MKLKMNTMLDLYNVLLHAFEKHMLRRFHVAAVVASQKNIRSRHRRFYDQCTLSCTYWPNVFSKSGKKYSLIRVLTPRFPRFNIIWKKNWSMRDMKKNLKVNALFPSLPEQLYWPTCNSFRYSKLWNLYRDYLVFRYFVPFSWKTKAQCFLVTGTNKS